MEQQERRTRDHGCRRDSSGDSGGVGHHLRCDGLGGCSIAGSGQCVDLDPSHGAGPGVLGKTTRLDGGGAARRHRGFKHAVTNWGSGALVDMLGPTTDTAFNRRLMAVLERSSATPAAIQAYFEWAFQQDIQDVLRAVQAPTRVLCVPDLAIPEAAAQRRGGAHPEWHVSPHAAKTTRHVHRPDCASDDRPP